MVVRITVSVGGRSVPVEQVSDSRIAGPIAQAGREIGRTLERIKCPVHDTPAENVRIHFDAQGRADLQYDSCCNRLGAKISAALG